MKFILSFLGLVLIIAPILLIKQHNREQKLKKAEGEYAAGWYFSFEPARTFRVYMLAFMALLLGIFVLADAIGRF